MGIRIPCLVAAATALLGVSAPALAQCTADAECPAGFACKGEGACVRDQPAGEAHPGTAALAAPGQEPSAQSPSFAPVIAAPAQAPGAQNALLGEVGESCRSRADCETGLRCFDQVCRDEREGMNCTSTPECGGTLRCRDHRCVGAYAPASAGASGATGDLDGAHPFIGVTLAPGFSGAMLYERGDLEIVPSMLVAMRMGVLVNQLEFAVEVSPVTWFVDLDGGSPLFQVNGTLGGLLRLSDRFYWPIRFGAGVLAINTPGDEPFFQSRFDLLGVVYKADHALFELSLPSFRFATDFENVGVWSWVFGPTVSYLH